MTRATTRKKGEDLRITFNRFLDEVFSAGPSFSMQTLDRYAEAAVAERERAHGERMREVTPIRREEGSELSDLVFTRVEQAGRASSRDMTERGLNAALELGERMELSVRDSRQFSLREWVRS
ncbi:hypothetical protein KKE92_00145 [Candidatus Micrarchaeota archaeon]|nr:hypothetical protein [Candidatus Micrarchaeota archaeon]MBU1681982.1 hypothetical protein [Candidatus Micrarchaeota archaeon]